MKKIDFQSVCLPSIALNELIWKYFCHPFKSCPTCPSCVCLGFNFMLFYFILSFEVTAVSVRATKLTHALFIFMVCVCVTLCYVLVCGIANAFNTIVCGCSDFRVIFFFVFFFLLFFLHQFKVKGQNVSHTGIQINCRLG